MQPAKSPYRRARHRAWRNTASPPDARQARRCDRCRPPRPAACTGSVDAPRRSIGDWTTPAQDRRRRAGRGHPHRPDAGGGAGGARAAVAPLGARRRPPTATAKARRVYYLSMEFLIGRTLGNALAALGPERRRRRRRCTQHAARSRTWPTASPTRRWATAAWAGWRPASSTRWPRSACPPSATASATSTACSRRTIQRRPPGRVPRPLAGRRHALGVSARRASATRCASAAGSSTDGDRARLAPRRRGRGQGLRHGRSPATAPTRSARCACGRRVAPAHIDLNAFNTGDYARAAECKNEYENISWVLYPNDSTPAGRELRLRQEYFFVTASMQDILARHLRRARHASTTWPTRWRSTSTTPTRRSAWPS